MPKMVKPAQPLTVYLGIDPGNSGGLAALCGDLVEMVKMPATERDVWSWLRWVPKHLADRCSESVSPLRVIAFVERVGGYVAGNPTPGSAMFKFGRGVGVLVGCLIAADIPYEEVLPSAWQRGLGIAPRKKSESKTAWKNRLKSHAQRLFPGETVTLATCDALLIAEYGRRKQGGRL